MDDTIAIVEQVLQWRSQGKKAALATVVKTWGSAPRRTGSMMCINSDMQFQGSVSGGCVETAVIDEALTAIKTNQARLLEFGVSNEQAWDVGLACGGSIEVYVQPVNAQQEDLFSQLLELNANTKAALLFTRLDSDGAVELIKENEINYHSLLSMTDVNKVKQSLRQDRPELLEFNNGRYFLQPFNPELTVYIVGAVHITQQLVPIIQQLGFKTYVIDPRMAFATENRFPNVQLVKQWPDECFVNFKLNHRSAVITLTHDPKFDDPALMTALGSDAFYVGALGSRKTHAGRLERLKQQGLSDEQLSRIDAPIGLDIKASNPAEIAVSIAAGLIQALRQSD